jgi:hypothetical protein
MLYNTICTNNSYEMINKEIKNASMMIMSTHAAGEGTLSKVSQVFTVGTVIFIAV